MADEWSGEERRQHPRVDLDGEVKSKLQTVAAAPVVDVSIAGALLEVPCTLPSEARYSLKLALSSDKEIELNGEVVRSYVHGFEKNDKGETTIKYRAAIKFVELTSEQERQLKELVDGQTNPVSAELSS